MYIHICLCTYVYIYVCMYIHIKYTSVICRYCLWTLKHLIGFYRTCFLLLSGWLIYLILGCFPFKGGERWWHLPSKFKKVVLSRFSLQIRKLNIKYLQLWRSQWLSCIFDHNLFGSQSLLRHFFKLKKKKVHKKLACTGTVLGEWVACGQYVLSATLANKLPWPWAKKQ